VTPAVFVDTDIILDFFLGREPFCQAAARLFSHALASPFSDFEDALQYHTALPAGMTAVITRNIRDYRTAAIPVVTAEEYLSQLAS
jgi:predicted nucleic acid-binding protein